MKKSRFSEEQIIEMQRVGPRSKISGTSAGINAVTFYKWKAKFEGMEISKMRLLDEENARLKTSWHSKRWISMR